MRISHFSRMNYVMTDEATGMKYKLAPGPQDVVEGIMPYVPELHAHLWTYVTLHAITYTNQPNFEDWDENICVWNEDGHLETPYQRKKCLKEKSLCAWKT